MSVAKYCTCSQVGIVGLGHVSGSVTRSQVEIVGLGHVSGHVTVHAHMWYYYRS